MSTFERIRSGLPGLDSMLDSIRMGDNVVWQAQGQKEYKGCKVRPQGIT